MSKYRFKKGDEVEFFNKNYDWLIGEYIVAEDYSGDGSSRVYMEQGGNFNPKNIRLIKEVVKVKKVSNGERDYTFTARDASMVCSDEINISREYPIAVIQAKGYNELYVHGSLCNKAGALGISLPKGRRWPDDTYTIFCKDYKQLAKRLAKLKGILKAPWPKDVGTIQVRIKLLGSN